MSDFLTQVKQILNDENAQYVPVPQGKKVKSNGCKDIFQPELTQLQALGDVNISRSGAGLRIEIFNKNV